MKQQATLQEITEDLYQIALNINKCVSSNKTKFSKEKLKGLESTLQFYMNKYHLPTHPIKKNIESVHYDYTKGFNHINKVVIHPIVGNYMKMVKPIFSDKTEYLYKQTQGSIYAYIKINKDREIIPQKQTKFDQSFINVVSVEQLEETANHPLASKEMKQTMIGSPEMIEILRKYTEQIIINLRHTGFLEKLIRDEETRDHITLSKEELEDALFKPHTDCADTLALFIFWLNKYVKQLIIYQHYLFPNHIQRDILSHRENCYDSEYIKIYETLFGVSKDEYFDSLKKFISLAITIRDLYKSKDSFLNLLLKMQTENGKRDTLSLSKPNHQLILSYYNFDTNVKVFFHINTHRINQKYLQGLEMKKMEIIDQSIPKHLQVKKYQKSKFENYV